ncbi:MAG: septal ring lytic transglycosylase RlpA family protein [Frankiaceae bacterium]
MIGAALVAPALPIAAPARAAPGQGSPAALRAALDAATAQAQSAADAVLAEQARDVYLRVALDRIADERRTIDAQLGRRAHDLYEATQADPVSAFLAGLQSPTQQLLDAAASRTGGDAADLLGQATRQATALRRLAEEADRLRASLQRRAAQAYAAQDRARALLERAQAAYAVNQAAERAGALVRRQLAARRAQLDALSEQVTLAVAVDAGPRGRAALSGQRGVLAVLQAAGAGYPAGYAPTGQALVGESSWYGPGFAGNPTASGAPYDPEQLTCAMLAVPLGTVVHVTDPATGRAVNMLVNDRGPYADGRIIDSSHAGAVALGFSGVARVRVEVLAPTG